MGRLSRLAYSTLTSGGAGICTGQGIRASVRIPEQTLAATENAARLMTSPRHDSRNEGPGSSRDSVVVRRIGASDRRELMQHEVRECPSLGDVRPRT